MAAKVGRLEFNGETLDMNNYKKLIDEYIPKGRIAEISFKMPDYAPFKAYGIKTPDAGSREGMMIPRGSGAAQRSFKAQDTVRNFPLWTGPDKGYVMTDGLLVYYEEITKRRIGKDQVNEYTPDRLYFVGGYATFPKQNLAKIMFLLYNSENKRNQLWVDDMNKEHGWSQKPGVFEVVLASSRNKANVDKASLKMEAFSVLNKLLKEDTTRLRNLYEALGYSDWDFHIDATGTGDFNNIMGPLTQLADSNPSKILELTKDSGLDLTACVALAISTGIVGREGNTFVWGPKAKGGQYVNVTDPKDKKITGIAPGKFAPDIAVKWFTDWCVRNPEVMKEIKVDLETERLKTT